MSNKAFTFVPVHEESRPEFAVLVDSAKKIVMAKGIGDAEMRHHTGRHGGGLSGLIRGYRMTHRVESITEEEFDKMEDEEDPDSGEDEEEDEDDAVAKLEPEGIVKTDSERQIVFGWAYTSHDKDGQVVVDKSGEFIDDIEELESGAYAFVVKSRKGGDWHQRNDDGSPVEVGTLVESMVFTPEKMEKMGIPPGTLPMGAWWVGFQLSDGAWQDVKAGKRSAFSIAGKAIRKAVQ